MVATTALTPRQREVSARVSSRAEAPSLLALDLWRAAPRDGCLVCWRDHPWREEFVPLCRREFGACIRIWRRLRAHLEERTQAAKESLLEELEPPRVLQLHPRRWREEQRRTAA